MTLYQRKTLPSTLMGDPAPLPAALVGLSDASLADLSAAVPEAAAELGYSGQGFFPFTPEPPPPPPPVDELHKVDFLRLFTQAERIAIRQAAKVNPIVEDYQAMLDAATVIRLSDADIQEGIPDLEDAMLIGPGRAAQILSGENP
jgi:hypothetical protein